MPSPDNPFAWFDVNQGYVLSAPQQPTGTISSSSGTITGLSANANAVQGQLVQGASLTLPSFTNASFTNSGSLVINKNGAGNASGQTITIENWPVLIGGDWSATIAAGGTLLSSYWNGNGIIRIQDIAPNSSPYSSATPTPGAAALADIFFICGGSVSPAAGQAIVGWFLPAIGDGATFENLIATAGTATAALSRSPDFVIPLDNATWAAGNIRFANGGIQGGIALPPGPFKTVIWNAGTIALPAGGAIVALPKDRGY